MKFNIHKRSNQAVSDSEFIIEEIRTHKKTSPLLFAFILMILAGGLTCALLVGYAVASTGN